MAWLLSGAAAGVTPRQQGATQHLWERYDAFFTIPELSRYCSPPQFAQR